MNKKIAKVLENNVLDYNHRPHHDIETNSAVFRIIGTFFGYLNRDKKLEKKSGITYDTLVTSNNIIEKDSDIYDHSGNQNGVSIMFTFDGNKYSLRLYKYIHNGEMIYNTKISSNGLSKFTGYYIYKYVLYSALDVSNLKGSYFTMPRKQYSWEVKTIEPKTFDDIYLPDGIMEDLRLFVKIYNKSGKVLRYLKVGNPGVGKTESTIIIANELNKLGVTVIKTPICELLHEKVELANLLSPSLIIFDDIDLSLGSRNSGGFSQLLGDFLDILDGTDKLSNDVGVIATTNAAHLLDLAAQRPGRFDKTLLFDNITKGNVRDIIIKSLKHNFKLVKGREFEVYVNGEIVNKFYKAGVSGAHIYNSIKMLKLRYDTLEMSVTVDIVLNDITNELDVIDKIRKSSELKSKYDRSNGMGFRNEEIDEDGYDTEVEERAVPRKTGFV
tara:strand:+ start:141123 stop:142445 length:1323 start_codon:yes stop_codon:yes gene_type:complete